MELVSDLRATSSEFVVEADRQIGPVLGVWCSFVIPLGCPTMVDRGNNFSGLPV